VFVENGIEPWKLQVQIAEGIVWFYADSLRTRSGLRGDDHELHVFDDHVS